MWLVFERINYLITLKTIGQNLNQQREYEESYGKL
jgi:hypothetical protein